MKKIIPLISLSIFIFSCNKSSVTTNSSHAHGTSFLKTAKSYYSSSQGQPAGITEIADSFVYDTSHNMTQYFRYKYDSTIGSSIFDSMEITFSFAPNAVVPDLYTYTDIPEGITNEVHQLSYDYLDRIVKDTSLGGVGGRNFANYFSYSNYIVTAWTMFNGALAANLIDSLFFNAGNIAEERIYYPDSTGSADTLSDDIYNSYFSFGNPAYYSTIAHTIGPLLHVIGLNNSGTVEDAISLQMINGLSSTANGVPQGTIDISLTIDSEGRILYAVTGAPYQGLSFVYTYY